MDEMAPDRSKKYDVLIVGGGVVGAAVAYYSAQSGARVLLIERGRLGGGATEASAGLLVPSYSRPLASPDNIYAGLRSLIDPGAAIKVRPRLDPAYIRWGLKFLRAGWSHRRLSAGIDVLNRIKTEAFALFDHWFDLGRDRLEHAQNGWLHVYRSEKLFQKSQKSVQPLIRMGLEVDILSGDEVRSRCPALAGDVVGGLHYLADGQVRPGALTRLMAEAAVQAGAAVVTGVEALSLEVQRAGPVGVLTTAGRLAADQVVLANGAYIKPLAKTAGLNVPVEGAKGYSLSFQPPTVDLDRQPLELYDDLLVISPYRDLVRLTSGMDLDGLDLKVRPGIERTWPRMAEAFLPGLNFGPLVEVRRGFRPLSPDDLPIIGRFKAQPHIISAGGHGQRGVSLGPWTGRTVADLLAGQDTAASWPELSPDRF